MDILDINNAETVEVVLLFQYHKENWTIAYTQIYINIQILTSEVTEPPSELNHQLPLWL